MASETKTNQINRLLGEERRRNKFISRVVRAQDAHFMQEEGGNKPGSKKWGKMVAKAGRNEKFRDKLNTVLTGNYDQGTGSGTFNDPKTGGEMGSHLIHTDPIITSKPDKQNNKKSKIKTRPIAPKI